MCFFTNNSSRKHTDYIERLKRLGLEVTADEVYTSGQVTCEYLLEHHTGKKVLLLGNDRLKAEFAEYGIETVETHPDIAVIAFDTSLTYENFTVSAGGCRRIYLTLPPTPTISVPRKYVLCPTWALSPRPYALPSVARPTWLWASLLRRRGRG